MMFNRLVVNGDSYMEVYSQGRGHNDLAAALGIEKACSLAIGGSANSRVIRTTLKDSFLTDEPTFYVLGIGFLSRWEVPILRPINEFEGRWTNPQNQDYRDKWEHHWTDKDTKQLIELKLKSDVYSIPDRLEELALLLTAMTESLHSRGHRVLMFQQADNLYTNHVDEVPLDLYKNHVFIDSLKWRAVPWQLTNGVPTNELVASSVYTVPDDIRHPASGHHQLLNSFLTNYIKEHRILE